MKRTDLTASDSPATDNTTPYVAVGTDKATGRAIIALDAAAVDALTDILDDLVGSGRFSDPGAHGISDDAAVQQSAVAHAILRPLLKLQGFLS